MERKQVDHSSKIKVLFVSGEDSVVFILGLAGLVMLATVTDASLLDRNCFENMGIVHCYQLAGQDIPVDLPRWIQNLTVTGSNITVLRREAFANNGTAMANLSTLILTHNGIQVIEALAFHDLPSLATLDLSHNPLSSMAAGAFWGLVQLHVLKMNNALRESLVEQFSFALLNKSLGALRKLELADNGLQTFPATVLQLHDLEVLNLRNNSVRVLDGVTVAGLNRQRRPQLFLNLNPFVCDCHLKPMHFWLRNTSQVLDDRLLKCFSPPAMNSSFIMKLKSEDLKCINEDLETASYVFFGIVLALIGVIFLMVLYLNRRGMKKWLNNFREACRDQMEGYHYRYEQDADPRRVNFTGGV